MGNMMPSHTNCDGWPAASRYESPNECPNSRSTSMLN